jgi:hypothetical protein
MTTMVSSIMNATDEDMRRIAEQEKQANERNAERVAAQRAEQLAAQRRTREMHAPMDPASPPRRGARIDQNPL